VISRETAGGMMRPHLTAAVHWTNAADSRSVVPQRRILLPPTILSPRSAVRATRFRPAAAGRTAWATFGGLPGGAWSRTSDPPDRRLSRMPISPRGEG
jgi:hypothetical protein